MRPNQKAIDRLANALTEYLNRAATIDPRRRTRLLRDVAIKHSISPALMRRAVLMLNQLEVRP